MIDEQRPYLDYKDSGAARPEISVGVLAVYMDDEHSFFEAIGRDSQ